MPRERIGSFDPWPTPWPSGAPRFRYRLRLGDGTKTKHFDVPEGLDDPKARAYVRSMQANEDAFGKLLDAKNDRLRERAADAGLGADGETCDAFYVRYHAHQVAIGRSAAGDARHRWRKWISPRIGPRPITNITSDDIENVRDALDDAIRAYARAGLGEDRISGKTAMNVWSALVSAFKAATSSKRRDLRVLAGKVNPCLGVEPPGDRASRRGRRKSFVYPREAAAVFACEEIPLPWREAHAIAAFTYLRPGELRVLTVGDVDLDARAVNVTKAWDYRAAAVKPPKTHNGVRRVPIEPALVPLLTRICKGKPATALVVPVLSSYRGGRAAEDQLAIVFRNHLERADVKRAELHKTTATHVRANFRSWRDSGLTWLAMMGLDVAKIMRRAGHDNVQTTMGYVKLAEDLSGDLGEPFAPLPDALVEGRVGENDRRLAKRLAKIGVNSAEALYRRRDSNAPDASTSEGVRELPPPLVIAEPTKPRDSSSTPAPTGQAIGQGEALDGALARALDAAVAAGRLDDVARIVEELRSRRLAREENVVPLRARKA